MGERKTFLFDRRPGPVALSLLLLAVALFLPRATSRALQAQAPPASTTESLEPNRKTVRLIWGKSTSFVFTGQAGEVITLRTNSRSPGLDPHLCLLDPENLMEAFDDDSGERGNGLIQNHILKQSGQYTIIVGLDNRVQGSVEILLEKTDTSGGAPALGSMKVVSSSELSCEAGSPDS